MTSDEHLRALAALEVVAKGGDEEELMALAGDDGEHPLPALLVAYGRHTLQRILLAVFGADDTMSRDEITLRVDEINEDPLARMTFALTSTLRTQAASAGNSPVAAKQIGMSLLLAVHALTGADTDDALTLLRALRGEALRDA